jgi:hypothetical protein
MFYSEFRTGCRLPARLRLSFVLLFTGLRGHLPEPFFSGPPAT